MSIGCFTQSIVTKQQERMQECKWNIHSQKKWGKQLLDTYLSTSLRLPFVKTGNYLRIKSRGDSYWEELDDGYSYLTHIQLNFLRPLLHGYLLILLLRMIRLDTFSNFFVPISFSFSRHPFLLIFDGLVLSCHVLFSWYTLIIPSIRRRSIVLMEREKTIEVSFPSLVWLQLSI